MLTLEKKDPAAAERIKMGQYDTWRERSAAIDAAIAEAEYRARAAAAKPRAAGKEPSAKPGSGDGSGRPKPLSLAEQIAFQVRDIPDDQLRVLKKMAKGDDRTLLDLAEKFHKNG